MPLPAIPRIENVRETIVGKPRQRQQSSIAKTRGKPALIWGYTPNRNGNIRTGEQSAVLVGGMEPAPDVLKANAK